MPTVLTIDDHCDSCLAVAAFLRLEGLEAEIATTGRHGIARALAQPADVVLVDLHLPDMSGIDVVRALRSHGIAAPIIITTAFPDLDQDFDPRAVGANGYIEGLFSLDELLGAVRTALSECGIARHSVRVPFSRSGNAADRRIRHVVSAIEREGDTPWSISELGRRLHLSDSRLRHLFTETMGMPLSQFIRLRRLHRLAQRLVESAENIESIASRVHLPSDLRRMRAAFRQRFGMTPTAYRQRFKRIPRTDSAL